MNKSRALRYIFWILFSQFVFTSGFDFSKSSIKAFDRDYWRFGPYGQDTTIIHNSSNSKKVIDSLSIELDSPVYSQFEIGWIGLQNGSSKNRFFNSDNFAFGNECTTLSEPTKRGITLSEYKGKDSSEKITFQPNEKMKMFSPYFSICRTDLGNSVDCINGPCVSEFKVDQISLFNGRIIFFTGLNRDTLHLLCERTANTTSVQKKIIPSHTLAQENDHYAINILGRKLSCMNKLDAYHSFKLQKEHSIVQH